MSESSSQLPQFHVVGFSGHRVLENSDGVARAIAAELEALRRDASGEWIALSSVAEGSDQVFIEEARKLGVAWHAILPLPRSEFAKDFSAEQWAKVERLIAHAEHVRIITENGTREDAYLDCGMETANGADVLLAVWNGEPARGRGGTADVVRYAKSLRKPIIIIDPATLTARRQNFNLLERVDKTLLNLNLLPDASAGFGGNPFKAPHEIFAFQQKCDRTASKGAPQFRRLIVLTVMLHVIATLVAAATLSFDLHFVVLPWVKLSCLAGALGVALVLRHHHHSHHSWVRCRLAAEFCRSALATWGLPRAAPLFEDLDVPGVRGLARALHVLHSRSAAAQPVAMEEFKRIYLEKRVEDQLAYYRRQESRALPLFARLKLGFWIATLLALGCTLAYAIAETMHASFISPEVRRMAFYFLPISLPVIAASFISLISINDLQRRVARFREMQLVLEHSRQRVTFCTTWNSLSQIVLKTERALMQEVLEWHSITSFAESH
jgi:hypothetical protein